MQCLDIFLKLHSSDPSILSYGVKKDMKMSTTMRKSDRVSKQNRASEEVGFMNAVLYGAYAMVQRMSIIMPKSQKRLKKLVGEIKQKNLGLLNLFQSFNLRSLAMSWPIICLPKYETLVWIAWNQLMMTPHTSALMWADLHRAITLASFWARFSLQNRLFAYVVYLPSSSVSDQ